MTAHTLRKKGKKVILIKPSSDIRDEGSIISSRIGLNAIADVVLYPDNFPVSDKFPSDIDIVLVDEVQFLSVKNIEMLRELASEKKITVICYGLLTDYRSKLFHGSKRLVELADCIKEIRSPGDCCSSCCMNKAIINSKISHSDDGLIVIKGGSSLIDVGREEKYRPMCWSCWHNS
jgi:thymidine kinase